MKLATIIVTRSKACHVKTLHTVLRLNLLCIQARNTQNEVVYVDDDPYEKSAIIQKFMKNADRILFIDFGVSIDSDSLKHVFNDNNAVGCIVFPGVTEGIDWDMFKAKVKEGSTEPVEQMGLHFDTKVGKKIAEDIYQVEKTSARAWVMMCKHVLKCVKDKRTNECKVPPRMEHMFAKFKELGVKINAFTASKLTMTYTHECISNLLNAAGVKAN
jgi:hypothetical protein